jgi:hypothetical protein
LILSFNANQKYADRNNRCYEIQSRYVRAQAGSTEAMICRVLLRFGNCYKFTQI